jgi:starch synthase
MSEKLRVLYVTEAMMPYLPESNISQTSRKLPQTIQEKGKEIRNFMPRYGCINERRHQLHEVIRLSGMNLVVDDHDHPLIIKVASIPQAKMQVYFIDNEEFFKRKSALVDNDGKAHADNDERMIFFCKGVVETVKKLGWAPDVIHCHGWLSSLLPLYIKKMYNNEPLFENSKVVYSVYENSIDSTVNSKLINKLMYDNFDQASIDMIENPTYDNLHKLGASFADAVALHIDISDELDDHISSLNIPVMKVSDENAGEEFDQFYEAVAAGESVLAD